MPAEFALIERYFSALGTLRTDVAIGVGDDGAVLLPPPGQDLIAVVDTLVAGVHFPPDSAPRSVGHRALAVNLSDIAAMGGSPAWSLLAITLPTVDEVWLEEFAAGFGALARASGVQLVGGDTTSGPMSVTVQVLGFVPAGLRLLRSGGRPGDLLFVSGTPGDAACGLTLEQGKLQTPSSQAERILRDRFLFPTPRVALGEGLGGLASACIDVSDGLYADVAKLAMRSDCAAHLELTRLPCSPQLAQCVDAAEARRFTLTGGDDYELCFTVPPSRSAQLDQLAHAVGVSCTQIGCLTAGSGVTVTEQGTVIEFSHSGYEHFGG